MKRYIFGSLAIVALLLVLAFPVAVPAAPPAGNPHPAAAAAAPSAPAAERYPEIEDAIASLRNAREHLNHARHDFGGHRVDAIRAINDAIHQLQVCMEYDR